MSELSNARRPTRVGDRQTLSETALEGPRRRMKVQVRTRTLDKNGSANRLWARFKGARALFKANKWAGPVQSTHRCLYCTGDGERHLQNTRPLRRVHLHVLPSRLSLHLGARAATGGREAPSHRPTAFLNMAHARKSRPDSGLVFKAKVLKTSHVVPISRWWPGQQPRPFQLRAPATKTAGTIQQASRSWNSPAPPLQTLIP